MSEESQLEQRIESYQKEGINKVKLAVTDIDGVLRGKYISLEKFASIAADTAGFCDCVLGWDIDDQLYDNTAFTGWHTAFPDALYRLDLATERRLEDEMGTPFFLGEFVQADGVSPLEICPRSLYKRILSALGELGYGVNLSFEYEFAIFRETAHSVREKRYENLTPLSPGMFGYSVVRNTTLSDLFTEFMDYCTSMGFPLEGLHCETGPGVWEAALRHEKGVTAADQANLFKTFAKTFFQKREMIATFMAKWSMDYPGQSGHIHHSLYDLKTGNPVFYDSSAPDGCGETMRWFLGGLQKYLKEFLVMCAPTVNSYTRLVKGAWAPTSSTWGIENRTTAFRVINGNPKSQRIEFRIGSSDANPYLAASALLGAGMLGISEKAVPESPVSGNAYEIQDSLPERYRLPANLRDATRLFQKSEVARNQFGDAFVDHFSATRDWEVREYERHVNDWHLKRYFESI